MAPDPGSRTRLISYHSLSPQDSGGATTQQGPPQAGLLILSTHRDVSARVVADAEYLSADGHPVRWAFAGPGPAPGAEPPGYRQLSPTSSPARLRGLLAGLTAPVSGSSRRARVAASLDPWFQQAVESVDLVLALDDDAAAMLPVAERIAPHTRRHGPDDGAAVVAEQADWGRLAAAEQDVLAAGRAELRADGPAQRLVAVAGRLAGTGRLARAVPREVHWLLANLTRFALPELAGQAADTLLGLPGIDPDDAVVQGYAAVAELDATAATEVPVRALAVRVLAEADTYLAARDLPMAVRAAGLALDLLFHRELHSDVERSELVEDPAGLGQLLRASTVGDLLTRPTPPAPGPGQGGARDGAGRAGSGG